MPTMHGKLTRRLSPNTTMPMSPVTLCEKILAHACASIKEGPLA